MQVWLKAAAEDAEVDINTQNKHVRIATLSLGRAPEGGHNTKLAFL